jgi:membrane protein
MSLICKRFQTDLPPYTAESLSDEHKIPIRLTTTILYELQDLHMIFETPVEDDEEEMAYLPSVDINRMNVAMLLSRLDTEGSEAFKIDRDRYNAPWKALTEARKDYYDSTSQILLKDL